MTTLADYIRIKREDERVLDENAERIREEWLRLLEELMTEIDGWLAPAVAEGLTVRKSTATIMEERLGSYEAPRRVVEFGGRRVRVEPKARIIVGGHGRVDVEGKEGTAFLIYWKPEARWMIVRERDWSKRVPLTEETFTALMEEFL